MNRADTIEAIFETMHQYKRSMHGQFAPMMQKLQISPAQVHLLLTLAHNQPLSHKDLAQHMQLTPGAISQLLDGLDDNNLIVRSPNPADRRISYLSLSRTGKKKVDQLNELRKKMFLTAFEPLDDEELQSYLRIQQKILVWLQDNQPPVRQK